MQETVSPDLQATVACEDARMEINGSQTLVGVINAIFAPQVPVRLLKFCLWTRWSGGYGRFLQRARVLAPDEEKVICENEVSFDLNHIESHATNVHFFPGVQFDVYGAYHVEIYLGEDLKMRYPLCVVKSPEQKTAMA